ncbi:two-component system, LuxR family, response regulator DctR/two-component system, LuxR family, response regulator FixJ [Rhizobiales bacterium GAS191]|jgi:FixJ family two-component response regulator|nr:two-component system, LuxR family, response regulator DctR/two-component system, LuxR family, response regulator FixJ [Rhizobiales bacterium GAS113]SEC26923.1 two-component system, LuxR family, response regulator DctR/two-component system, LuxR family, response regulator FixJ [Rhizobiales bacterium GAS188]SEC98553.1 two-component system, LuxR family, response regulator DctR/two-component system, LuxR family, response regulator FixJ [Rhizobiales bacterium GAS191]
MGETVYIVDPLPAERSQILVALASEPVTLECYESAEQFLCHPGTMAPGCVIALVDLEGMGVRGLIKEILRRDLALAVVVIGRSSDLVTAVELVRAGASDFLERPFSDRRLRSAVRRAIGGEA